MLSFKNLYLYQISIIIFFVFFMKPAFAAEKTYGAWAAAPNAIWPNHTYNSGGDFANIDTAMGNPDVYCATREGNWRLPSVVELSSGYRNAGPMQKAPYFPESYKDPFGELIPANLIPNNSHREVTGALWNEWGALNTLPGFVNEMYWVREPWNASNRLGVNGNVTYVSYAWNTLGNTMCIHDIE